MSDDYEFLYDSFLPCSPYSSLIDFQGEKSSKYEIAAEQK